MVCHLKVEVPQKKYLIGGWNINMGYLKDKISQLTLPDKINKSIEALKLASKMSEQYYHRPLIITYSGGKDSDVMLNLAKRSGINFEVYHSHTTADAPQTVYHVRNVFDKLHSEGIRTKIVYPTYKGKRTSMWDLIVQKKMLPTRRYRYCCDILKETTGKNRFISTGVRADESRNRSDRKMFTIYSSSVNHRIYHDIEHVAEVYDDAQKYPEVYDCKYITSLKKNKTSMVNPIVEWNVVDIWNYIKDNNVEVCNLYDMGYDRVGCVGCPLASQRKREGVF